MAELPQKHSRDLSIFGLTVIVGLAGWIFQDRLRMAAKEQQFDDDVKTIVELKGKLDSIPQNFVTRQEFEQMRQLIQTEHAETITAIGHLGDRIDRLAVMGGVSNSKDTLFINTPATARK